MRRLNYFNGLVNLLLLFLIFPLSKTAQAQSGPSTTTLQQKSALSQPVRVPNVIGISQSTGVQTIFAAGLIPVITYTLKHNPGFNIGQISQQSPGANTPVKQNSKVTITVNSIPRPSMGIRVSPPNGPYTVGAIINIIEDLNNKNPQSFYTYIWHVDGGEVSRQRFRGNDPTRSSVTLPPLQPGPHYVQLDVISDHQAYPQWRDSIRRNIGIENPPGWVQVQPPPPPPVTPIRPLGRRVNRFETRGGIGNLTVCSSYWKASYTYASGLSIKTDPGGWTPCTNFDTIGAVDAFDLYTGQQAYGHNTGFLVYIPAGRNEILFRVYGFRFGDPLDYGAMKGYRRYSGRLDTRRRIPIPGPGSIQWILEQSRAGIVRWLTIEGNICRARIWKTKGSSTLGTITQKVFVKGGVEDLGCDDNPIGAGIGIPPPPTAAIGQALQFGLQFQEGPDPGSSTGLTNVTVSQQAVTLTFWDHGQVDGDIINIYLNGQLIKGNLELQKAKQPFRITLNSGQNTFEIEAVNEGRVPPNTASVKISNVVAGQDTQISQRKSSQRASMFLTAP